jgi:carbamoyl-phosphate synthase large subunit
LTSILLLSAGRRVELLQGFRDARTRLAGDVRVLAGDCRPHLSAACQLADSAFMLPRISDPDYLPRLHALCRKEDVRLVVPTIDPELPVLAAAQQEFRDSGIELVISNRELVERCVDKRSTSGLFAELGIPTPEIYDRDAILYPCFSKPASGSSSDGALRCESADSVSPGMLADQGRIFMELIPADFDEITIDLYYDRNGELRCMVPRTRIETRAGEVSKGVTRRDWVYDLLWPRLVSMRGARGPVTLQLFARDQDRSASAIEINPRFGGGFPLSLSAGADFPGWLIEEYLLGSDVARFESWEPGLMMLRYDAKVLVHGGYKAR